MTITATASRRHARGSVGVVRRIGHLTVEAILAHLNLVRHGAGSCLPHGGELQEALAE